MKHRDFSFEEEFRRIYTSIGQESRINEIQLYDTNIRIFIFYIRNTYYISIFNLIEVFEYFLESKLDESVYSYIKSLVETFKQGDIDVDAENKDLEVCKCHLITNQIFTMVYEHQNHITHHSEEQLFNKIEMLGSSKSSTDNPLNTMYPFIPSWNDTAMNDILQNIYTNDEFTESTPVQEIPNKKYMGRGRCRVKQANLKERPFVCDYPDCKRAFKRFEHLKRHNKMHTGERPYKCKYPGCMKAFSRSDNLSQHFKIHNVSSKGPSLNFRSYQYSNKEVD
ncbi:Zinc finger C2H2 protein [Nosema granulosis]|uniref:Zinc finger C2H2 protein n=1 Tax=Nosema granulosis TaxID=83296 RepID=A0A9P6GZY8_9MICR|nr:Zinc finger C2H2 protein [Nosema granulosis]